MAMYKNTSPCFVRAWGLLRDRQWCNPFVWGKDLLSISINSHHNGRASKNNKVPVLLKPGGMVDARGLDASVGATIHHPTTAGRTCLAFSPSVSFGRWAEWILWLPSPYRTVYVNPLTTSPPKTRVPRSYKPLADV
ncbi:unnamed protein product [Clonostachys rhizophaga]|uniref:Uncharacterized protein n=1 Tax=Clonostachys rhizophaga TaxID=160324 RepID=A0A9N9VL67_9HYPO|nr:unnamed protein product [Clonostachys rhizophaga]